MRDASSSLGWSQELKNRQGTCPRHHCLHLRVQFSEDCNAAAAINQVQSHALVNNQQPVHETLDLTKTATNMIGHVVWDCCLCTHVRMLLALAQSDFDDILLCTTSGVQHT